MWKNFDVNTKTQMNEIYDKELKEYKESLKVYKEKLTDDQKNELFRMKYEQLEQKTKRKIKKVYKIYNLKNNLNYLLLFYYKFILGTKRIGQTS